MPVTRRQFVAAFAGAVAAPSILPASVLGRAGQPGANGKLGLGFIGIGIQNRYHLDSFLKNDAVRVLAVCDVDSNRRNDAKARADKRYGNTDCAAFVDYRELLARKDIDAVVIATPDHWHASQVIDAAKARKDIYCEKPLSLNLAECRLMIEAVRKHNVVFQTGSQQRTEFDKKFVTACEYVRSGRIGKVRTVHVGLGGPSSVPCDLPDEPMEPGLDWDRWLGPAPIRPYNSILSPRGINNFYPKWRNYREYSGGMVTDFGAHNCDIAQWGLGMDASGPVEVIPPSGDRDEYGAKLVYANGVEMINSGPFGITFSGDRGQIHVWRDRLSSIGDEILKEPLTEKDVHLPRPAGHHADWLACIASRTKPVCDVEVGARSIACAHLFNLAYWHRRRLKWDPAAWNFGSDAEANSWLDYARREPYGLPKA